MVTIQPRTHHNGLAVDREPWARQPREPEKAFAIFLRYRDQTPPRSIVKLAAELGRNTSPLYHLSSQFHWPQRINAWDVYVQKERDAATLEEVREMTKRQVALAMGMQEKLEARIRDLDPDTIHTRDIPAWIQSATGVERLARGEATERVDRGNTPESQVNVEVNVADQQVVFDEAFAGAVLDRLAEAGVIPAPLAGDGRPALVDDSEADAVHADGP